MQLNNLDDGIHALPAGQSNHIPSVKAAKSAGYDIKDIVVVIEIKGGRLSSKAVFVKIPGGGVGIKALDRHTPAMAAAAKQFFIDGANIRRR